jgi:hypothetical protein
MGKCGVISLDSLPTAPFHDDFMYNALGALMDTSRRYQFINRENALTFGNRAWLSSFCTLRIGGPRGSGHTRCIMRQIFDKQMSSYFFTIDNNEKNRVINEFQDYATRSGYFVNRLNDKILIFEKEDVSFEVRFDWTHRRVRADYMGVPTPTAIFVDNVHWIEDATERLLGVIGLAEDKINPNEDFFLIMVN